MSKKKRKQIDQGKLEGIWLCVQMIIIDYDQSVIARHIVEACGMSRSECEELQRASEYRDDLMLPFIRDEVKP